MQSLALCRTSLSVPSFWSQRGESKKGIFRLGDTRRQGRERCPPLTRVDFQLTNSPTLYLSPPHHNSDSNPSQVSHASMASVIALIQRFGGCKGKVPIPWVEGENGQSAYQRSGRTPENPTLTPFMYARPWQRIQRSLYHNIPYDTCLGCVAWIGGFFR
jgi:hypothetical protein